MSTTPIQEDEALVNKLYKISSTLDDLPADSPQEKKDEQFKNILKIAGSKGNFTKSKTLSAQLIARHIKDFPNLVEDSVNVLMDLCEEMELQVLIQAVKAFPAVCSQNLAQLPRVADVLGQLLQADVPQELDNVKQSLLALFRLDANGVLNTLTNQILTRNEEQREKAIEFLLTPHMKEVIHEKVHQTETLQSSFFDNIKKILASDSIELSLEKTTQLLELLKSLPFLQSSHSSFTSYSMQLLDTMATRIQLDKPLEKGKLEVIEKKITLMKTVIPFFSDQTTSSKYMQFILLNIVPQFPELTDETKMKTLKMIAELSPFVGSSSEAREIIPPIYNLFKQQTPLNSTKINFSFLECILFSFHQLAYKAPGSLSHVCGIQQFTGQPSDFIPSSDETPKKLFADFVQRLEFIKQNTTKYLQQLKETLQSNLQKEQRNTIQNAFTLTKSIHTMVNNLLNKPNPIFLSNKNTNILSWKEPTGKRKNENGDNNNANQQKKTKLNKSENQPRKLNQEKQNKNKNEQNNSRGGGSGGFGRGGRGGGFYQAKHIRGRF